MHDTKFITVQCNKCKPLSALLLLLSAPIGPQQQQHKHKPFQQYRGAPVSTLFYRNHVFSFWGRSMARVVTLLLGGLFVSTVCVSAANVADINQTNIVFLLLVRYPVHSTFLCADQFHPPALLIPSQLDNTIPGRLGLGEFRHSQHEQRDRDAESKFSCYRRPDFGPAICASRRQAGLRGATR